jgi:hypothetical protein
MQDMIASPIVKLLGTMLLTYSSHYTAANLYAKLCVPATMWGYLQGMIATGSPVCSAIHAYVGNSQTTYTAVITTTISRAIMDAILPGTTPAQA